jgi:hyperosmotically inducible protein
MKLQIAVLTCAVLGAACGSQDTRPAEDPTSTRAPAGRADTTAAPADMSGDNTSKGAAGATQLTAGTSTVNPSRSSPAADSREVGPVQVAQAPTVTNNPGVADQTRAADNTTINDRDRHGALTPMDQGNSGSEIRITAAIRKGLMADSTLSFTAKNVKVITVGSKVTLRGPVKSDQERATIAALAMQTSGVTEIDNQLEVKK